MLDRARNWYDAASSRVRRIERRESREFRQWIETTRNLVHVSALLFVPLLIAFVTALANVLPTLSFLLFPPLASGTYVLFTHPEEQYASPIRFVGGLTLGAVAGSVALLVSSWLATPGTPGGASAIQVDALGAALGVFLTGLLTWAFNLEEPSAFSTALLVLITDVAPETYVASVLLSSTIVAMAFVVWRDRFYERRAKYLYQSTQGDDHVLVPMRGDQPGPTAMLGAYIAAAHDAGKVVLLDVVENEAVARTERNLLDETPAAGAATAAQGSAAQTPAGASPSEASAQPAPEAAVDALESRAAEIETRVGVPCEVVVAVDGASSAATVEQVARETNCDLIVTPYEERHGALSPFVRDLFRGDVDVLVHRGKAGRTRWRDVMVPVRRPSDVAHSMIDFATRLTGKTGRISVAKCISSENDRREAESMLADLVETVSGNVETRVSSASIEDFLERNGPQYDLVVMGASMDRSTASRFISPPTFERIQDIDADVAIVDRNYRY
jgi:nucleotide-binding universal stress UspA family protein